MFQARPRSWVTTSTPSPSSARSFSSSARISPRIEASRLETGSSAISSSGSQRQRPGDQHPLPLAAGQLVRVAQEQPLGRSQPGRRQRVGHLLLLAAPAGSVVGHPVQPQPLGDRVVDGVPRVQRAGRVLEDHLHPAAERLAATSGRRPAARRRRAPRRRSAARRPIRVRASVVLPEPDSPTSATISPDCARSGRRRRARSPPRRRGWRTRPPRPRASRLSARVLGLDTAVIGSSPTRMQAASRRGALVVERRLGRRGTRRSPAGSAGANEQPGGSSRGSGGSPAARTARSARPGRRSAGTTPTSAAVYGCSGSVNSWSAGPCSTTRPAYITAIRSLDVGEHRQVVADHHHPDAELLHQRRTARPAPAPAPSRRAPSSARRRPRSDGPAGQRHRDHHPLPLAAGELVRVRPRAGARAARPARAARRPGAPPRRRSPSARAAGSARRSAARPGVRR